jgi:RNA polymerase sigma-70 factor (ECF subfamily)
MDSDGELLKRIAKHDERALKTLYERFEGRLHHFLYAFMKDGFAAGDVLNETMLEVWRSADRFEGRSKASTWIFGIARMKALMHMRKHARETSADPDLYLADDAPDAVALLSARDDAAAVRACIEELSPTHRAVVHFVFYEDMGYAEIASILDCPENTVKTRVFHAKRLLQHCVSLRLGAGKGG